MTVFELNAMYSRYLTTSEVSIKEMAVAIHGISTRCGLDPYWMLDNMRGLNGPQILKGTLSLRHSEEVAV